MCTANAARLAELEKEHENSVIDDEDQVSGLWTARLDYMLSIGDKESSTALAQSKLNDKTVPKTHRIDAVFALFRIAYFHGCDIKGVYTTLNIWKQLHKFSSFIVCF